MRHHTLCTAASAVLFVACTHTREEVRAPAVTADDAATAIEADAIALDDTPIEAAPQRRPRLSQTITLGQGAEQPYTPTAPPPPAGAPSQNVVVNNNVVVQQAPGFYGYGYGFGGGFGGFGGFGRTTTSFTGDGHSGGGRGTPQWGASGWEGARRTAAPGQTPGIGGNWSPPPSYGPAPMR
ncbi:MAG: hypothetical protein KF795_16985 [Labilithrix sp.]|nr:hypothetical protein [Labilithrix sp.]